ncbi:MAG: hypothetical protein JWQ96_1198 [Segetibacter sp.]|nr:hypothetical protein [Segetibacter sp.]
MPKLYSSSQVLKVLNHHGFYLVSQNGSHINYRKIGDPTLTVIIPAERKQIPQGTFNSILKQYALSKDDFEK